MKVSVFSPRMFYSWFLALSFTLVLSGCDGVFRTLCDYCGPGHADIDGDGLENSADNCPEVPNPNQADADHPCQPGEHCIPDVSLSDGGDLCDKCPGDYNGPPDEESLAPDTDPARCELPSGNIDISFVTPPPDNIRTFGDSLEVEVCINPNDPALTGEYIVGPFICNLLNLKLNIDGQVPPRRMVKGQGIGIGCPNDDDPFIHVIRAGYSDTVVNDGGAWSHTEAPFDEPYCTTCPLEQDYVLDPAELDIAPDGRILLATVSGIYNTIGIRDLDQPGLPYDTDDRNWCLDRDGENENGVIDLTPVYQIIPDITFSMTNPLEIEIDIRPGEFPNNINLGSQGKIKVALLSGAGFNPATVDPDTVQLAGAEAMVKGKKLWVDWQDLNGDGVEDMIVRMEIQALQLTDGDSEATLYANTFPDPPRCETCFTRLSGRDSVRVVPTPAE